VENHASPDRRKRAAGECRSEPGRTGIDRRAVPPPASRGRIDADETMRALMRN
jgi:hypothetical protein